MKSSDRILASRYAQAYTQLAASNDEAQQLDDALKHAGAQLALAASYMNDPKITIADKTAFVTELFGGQSRAAQLVALLLQAKRYYLLPQIVADAGALLDQRLGIVRAEVTSARELNAAQKADVEAAIGQRTGLKAAAVYKTDASLIGGLTILADGTLIEGSIRGRLTRLQEELTK